MPKEFGKELLKNNPILFRCAKRSILPSKAETSQKRMRSFYGQNSTAQSHKMGLFFRNSFSCIFLSNLAVHFLMRLSLATEVQSESEPCGFVINLLITCGYLFQYRMIANGEEEPFIMGINSLKRFEKENKRDILLTLCYGVIFFIKSQPFGESSNPSTRSSIKDLKYFATDYY